MRLWQRKGRGTASCIARREINSVFIAGRGVPDTATACPRRRRRVVEAADDVAVVKINSYHLPVLYRIIGGVVSADVNLAAMDKRSRIGDALVPFSHASGRAATQMRDHVAFPDDIASQ